MECHNVRLLLAFTQRRCEAVDAAERKAVELHLNACPDCAALAQNDRSMDDALGQAIRDVSVPADLMPNLMKRLAASRGMGRWKGAAAMAAGLLMALAGGVCWYHWSRPEVSDNDLTRFVERERWNQGWNADAAREYLRERGLSGQLPQDINYGHLRTVEVVDFKGRQVAKLGFAWGSGWANVLLLPDNQFRTNIAATNVSDWLEVAVRHQDDFTYVIFFRGDVHSLMADVN